jgi:hypothetical protein
MMTLKAKLMRNDSGNHVVVQVDSATQEVETYDVAQVAAYLKQMALDLKAAHEALADTGDGTNRTYLSDARFLAMLFRVFLSLSRSGEGKHDG